MRLKSSAVRVPCGLQCSLDSYDSTHLKVQTFTHPVRFLWLWAIPFSWGATVRFTFMLQTEMPQQLLDRLLFNWLQTNLRGFIWIICMRVKTKWFNETYWPTARPNIAKMPMTCHNRSPQKTTVSEVTGSGFFGGSVAINCGGKRNKKKKDWPKYLHAINKSSETGITAEGKPQGVNKFLEKTKEDYAQISVW